MDTSTELPPAPAVSSPCEAERSATGWPPRRWRPNWDSADLGHRPISVRSRPGDASGISCPISRCCWKLKVLGAVSLLVPGRALVKEWAYAGAFFTYTGAIVSHLTTGYDLGEVGLLAVMTALTIMSWASTTRQPPHTPGGGPMLAGFPRAIVRNILFTVVVRGWGSLGALVDLDTSWGYRGSGRLGKRFLGGRGGPVRVVCREFCRGGVRHSRAVGSAVACAPGPTAGCAIRSTLRGSAGGVAVHVTSAAGLRGHHGGLLPPVRHRLRRTDAAPPLRQHLPGVPAHGPRWIPGRPAPVELVSGYTIPS